MDRSMLSGSEVKCRDLKDVLPPRLTELNNRAVWSLSSCKTGYGIEHLLDNNTDTYWQSDGPQPHLVNIMFRKKTPVSHIAIYADLKADESYTPSRIGLRTGSHFNDLIELKQIELKDPSGWHVFELSTHLGDQNDSEFPGCTGNGSNSSSSRRGVIKTFMVQVAVLLNHQNGRDTHVRQIKIFGPRVQNVLPPQSAPLINHSCIIR